MGRDNNIFRTMGRYVTRQQENLLTLALVLLYNKVRSFRSQFNKLIPELEVYDADEVVAHPQRQELIANGKKAIFLDIIIENRERARICAVEVKLDAPFHAAQLKNYATLLASYPSIGFVVLSRYGIEREDLRAELVKPKLLERTRLVTWPLVAELAQMAQKGAGKLDRLLLGDFLETLDEEADIRPLPAIGYSRLVQLKRLTAFATRQKPVSVRHRIIGDAELVLQRLIAHRDHALRDTYSAWRPYQSMYRDDGHVSLEAGYWQTGSGTTDHWYIGLILHCQDVPTLEINAGRRVKGNPRSWDVRFSKGANKLPKARTIFALSLADANDRLREPLREIGAKLLKSVH